MTYNSLQHVDAHTNLTGFFCFRFNDSFLFVLDSLNSASANLSRLTIEASIDSDSNTSYSLISELQSRLTLEKLSISRDMIEALKLSPEDVGINVNLGSGNVRHTFKW